MAENHISHWKKYIFQKNHGITKLCLNQNSNAQNQQLSIYIYHFPSQVLIQHIQLKWHSNFNHSLVKIWQIVRSLSICRKFQTEFSKMKETNSNLPNDMFLLGLPPQGQELSHWIQLLEVLPLLEPVSLVKVFRLFRLEVIVLMFRAWTHSR